MASSSPNETKMSYRWRERALPQVEMRKSSKVDIKTASG
jgi:hypothetical protein